MKRPSKTNGSDKDAAVRQAALAELRSMPVDEVFALAVRAGIYSSAGKLKKAYKADRTRIPPQKG